MSGAGRIRLSIVTPERKVLEQDVEEVVLPGEWGQFGVLPGHTPYLARLRAGEADFRAGRVHQYLAIGGGFAEVQADEVRVLADSAERPEEISLEEAERQLAEAREAMKGAVLDGLDEARVRLDRALIRVQVAHRATLYRT